LSFFNLFILYRYHDSGEIKIFKITNFGGNYLANGKSYDKSFYEVLIEKLCPYRNHSLDLTLTDLEPRYRWVNFPTFCHFAIYWPIGLKFKYVVQIRIVNNSVNFVQIDRMAMAVSQFKKICLNLHHFAISWPISFKLNYRNFILFCCY